jgi:DNA-directed RNA polymerase specialized sigma24 family protein
MENLHSSWDEYAQLQQKARNVSRIDSYSWGVEAELDAFLSNPTSYAPRALRRVEKARQTASRRERAHKNLIDKYKSDVRTQRVDSIAMLESREALEAISLKLPATQWKILISRAEGESYDSIAKAVGISSIACRVQVLRFRKLASEYWRAA